MDDANSNENVIKTENESDSDYLQEDMPDYVGLEDIEETKRKETEKQNSGDNEIVNEFLKHSLYINQDENKDVDDDEENSMSSSNEEDTKCNICKQTFLDREDYNSHCQSRRIDDRKYCCCNCQKIFRDNSQLKVHSRKHTGEKPFGCLICGKKFTVNGNLNKHMRIHTGEKRFGCASCGKKFTQLAHLKDHSSIHSGEKPFKCDHCPGVFKTKARLKKHIRNHTDPNISKRTIPCPQCKMAMRNKRQLAAHLVTHDSEDKITDEQTGPFICKLCGKKFGKSSNLKRHEKHHLAEKGYPCSFCDKSFIMASRLKRHMDTHTGFKPYTCELCNRAFPSSQNLKRHIMTHTGEKPFECTVCNRSFLTLENLNRHKRTHTGEKPFTCKICSKHFAHSTTVKEHMRTVHTSEKPYTCLWCSKQFAISRVMYRHVKEKHPEHFQKFKAENHVAPNLKKARAKFSQIDGFSMNETGQNNVDSIKSEPLDGYDALEYSSRGLLEQIKTEPRSEEDAEPKNIEKVVIKHEINDDNVKRELEINLPLINNNVAVKKEETDWS
ncbi:hypothetical protein GWI33_016709 [Rhynchophorus ferrugineus]|uniref:C2H2-type domain-containing protein n=1 Tax=Rhynchophorus ferrugineus TaxID=354439 RepID=A0A834I0M2_RHYFE|nr:hypothetical protein GWI33_016709 [Rhynchophorus ferrugineus]